MTSREIVIQTIRFQRPERLARTLPEPYGTDIEGNWEAVLPDNRPPNGRDEWGCVWENIGVSRLGEVKIPALATWDDFDTMSIPDIRDPKRWEKIGGPREVFPDKFIIGWGLSLYERVHFLRGLENTWADIYEEPERLGRLIDILVDMNLHAIEQYARVGMDGYMFCDDWGLQDRLMISPRSWHDIWQPRYARVYQAAHEAGMLTFLHSCGYIVDILDGLIDAGLDVIQMDQQMNMGLDLLHDQFAGRIAFHCPVDIQAVMPHAPVEDIRAYCGRLVDTLATPEGGFIAGYYSDPQGAGHSPEAIEAMCSEFVRLGAEHPYFSPAG